MAEPLNSPLAVPPDSPSGRLIVCERKGDWAVALRRELGETGPRVYETRSLPDCWRVLADYGASFLVLELTPGLADEIAACLASLRDEYPAARAAVVAPRELSAVEWLVREAGAVYFTTSPRALGELAAIAIRHLALAPPSHRPLTEEIRARLPWAGLSRDRNAPA